MESYNSFRVAQQQILEAAKTLNLDEPTTTLLSLPQREFSFTLHVRMDTGKVKIFQGYRIQYNFARGPAKGGIRFHPEETIDTIRALGCWMTWKTAVVDLLLAELKEVSAVIQKKCLKESLKIFHGNMLEQLHR